MQYDILGALNFQQIETKPNLDAKSFSAQNAFHFVNLNKIAYNPKAEVAALVKGDGSSGELGFQGNFWFKVDRPLGSSLNPLVLWF